MASSSPLIGVLEDDKGDLHVMDGGTRTHNAVWAGSEPLRRFRPLPNPPQFRYPRPRIVSFKSDLEELFLSVPDYTRPRMKSSALLTIDVQNDFTLPGAPAEVAGTQSALPAMGQLLEAFRAGNRPIFHVVRLYKRDGSNVDISRRARVAAGTHMVAPGTEGAELVSDLKPRSDVRIDADHLLAGELQMVGPNEWIMFKPRWGAFYQTPLQEHLDALGVDSLVICGCNFPNCPRTTIFEASERDYRVAVAEDAISGLYARAVKELEAIGVQVSDTDKLVDELASPDLSVGP